MARVELVPEHSRLGVQALQTQYDTLRREVAAYNRERKQGEAANGNEVFGFGREVAGAAGAGAADVTENAFEQQQVGRLGLAFFFQF